MNDARSGTEADAHSEASGQSYDLFIRTSKTIFNFVNRNRGVTLADDRIAWSYGGKPDAALFSSIRSVHLQTAGSWESPVAICRITFADRYELIVTDANVTGYPDPERQQPWHDFVHDFHARMAASGNTSVRYTAGLQGHRYPVVIGAAIFLGVLFVIVPFFAMLWLQSPAPATAMLAGAALIWPLFKMIQKNAPTTYDPAHLPKDLLR